MRLLFLFLDGVGVGPADPARNPFARASLPHWAALAGGRLPFLGEEARGWAAVDACLGVEGLPQSGTGQVALLSGRNAARLRGSHVGPWIDARLKELLSRSNAFRSVVDAGGRACLANAFPDHYLRRVERGRGRSSAIVWAARLAGLELKGYEGLLQGKAVSAFLDHRAWQRLGYALPGITPREAGRRLARLAGEHDFTLFEYYLSDFLGHRPRMEQAVEALEALDAFLGGVLEGASGDLTVALCSDHGNLEELDHSRHTRNPVPLLAAGLAGQEAVRDAGSLEEVLPALLAPMGIRLPAREEVEDGSGLAG